MTPTKLQQMLADHARGKLADLSRANLSKADLSWAKLSKANLSWANLSGAVLLGANLQNVTSLCNANFDGALISWRDAVVRVRFEHVDETELEVAERERR